MTMINRLAVTLLLMLGLLASPLSAQEQDPFAMVLAQDLRLARTAEGLQRGNLALCRQAMPLTGLILRSRDQYGELPPGMFANGAVEIAGVLPGSAADLAGIAPGDGLVAVNGQATADMVPAEHAPLRDAAFDVLAGSSLEGRLHLTLRRGEEQGELALEAPAGCRVLVEILTTNERRARSDGRVLQISYGLASELDDSELAVVVAHELAHVVLEHRRRLSEAGVVGGLLGEFGRNRRLTRTVETEADRLSAHLLANAGYDPAIAASFWLSDAGRLVSRGILRSRAYPSRRSRAELIEEEIALHLQGNEGTSLAEHLLAARDLPFPD